MSEQNQLKIKSTNPNAFFIHVKDLIIEERSRTDFSGIDGLRDSIANLGCIQPPVVVKQADKYRLMAGERRTRAMLMLGAVEIPVVIRDHATELEKFEIEHDENFHRKNLDWVENARLIKKINAVKKAKHGDAAAFGPNDPRKSEAWSPEKTAEMVGDDRRQVVQKIQLADFLDVHPEKEAEYRNLPRTTAYKKMTQEKEAKALQARVDTGEVVLSSAIKLGDARDLIKTIPDASIDCVIWDPPFGNATIEDLEGKGMGGNSSSVGSYVKVLEPTDNLSLAESVELCGQVLIELKRVMKPGAYFFIFHCSDQYASLTALLRTLEFDFDPCPLIWDKGRSTSPGRGYTFMSSYEPILYGVKPPWERRLAKDERNIIVVPPVPSKQKKHPFQKPAELLCHLIKQVTDVGQVVLDPTCGSGATIFAAEDCRRSGIGFEKSPKNYALAQVWDRERKEGKAVVS